MRELIHFREPELLFRYEQALIDPRDGLALFGPLDKGKPYGIRWGAIGTSDSLQRMRRWVREIQLPIPSRLDDPARPSFPGFEAVFDIPWSDQPELEITLDGTELLRNAHLDDRHHRVYETVNTFVEPLLKAMKEEEIKPDVWCIVIPEYVYQNCRPKSQIVAEERIEAETPPGRPDVHSPYLFKSFNEAAQAYEYDVNFHHQLKGRLLAHGVPIQIVRESTIAHRDFLNIRGNPIRNLDLMKAAIAWHIATAMFYKSGGRPWKLGAAREGVCYVGLAFKLDDRHRDSRIACCAAQMFLDSGDGIVFKGAVGPWYHEERGHFHLDYRSAYEVIEKCLNSYREKRGCAPKQVFIHGKVRFDDDEWSGFRDAADTQTDVVGVRIREDHELKIYRKSDHPALRGLAFIPNNHMGTLWTRGFVPRLRTYPGREVPNALFIDVCRGEEDIRIVMEDILALTKLNYNACQFADGVPVTLKFANAVGEILTAVPDHEVDGPPLPFKHYI